jgi:hypothetical protein
MPHSTRSTRKAHAASRSAADRYTPCLRKAAGARARASTRCTFSSAGEPRLRRACNLRCAKIVRKIVWCLKAGRTFMARPVVSPADPPTLGPESAELREACVSAEASEMVSVPRAELDALKAELKRLRRESGRSVARTWIQADPGPGDDAPTFTREELAEAWGISE